MNDNIFSEQNAPSRGEIILYQTADGRTSIDVILENETVWLSKEQMATLFERDRTVISRHIKKIYEEGELIQDVICAKFAHMGSDADQTYIAESKNEISKVCNSCKVLVERKIRITFAPRNKKAS